MLITISGDDVAFVKQSASSFVDLTESNDNLLSVKQWKCFAMRLFFVYF